MEFYEVSPLPAVCEDCQEEDCYNCDNALDRWKLSSADKLHFRKKLKQKAIERMEREIAEIDRQLAELER